MANKEKNSEQREASCLHECPSREEGRRSQLFSEFTAPTTQEWLDKIEV